MRYFWGFNDEMPLKHLAKYLTLGKMPDIDKYEPITSKIKIHLKQFKYQVSHILT